MTLRIGMYDSGVGGLTVLAAFVRQMPYHDYIYFGDTRNAPYGDRSPEEIRQLSAAAIRRLEPHRLDALVVACNTSASVAVDTIGRLCSNLPFFTLVSASARAVREIGATRIGLLATRRTVEAGVFEREIRSACPQADVLAIPAPALVPLIERGYRDRRIYEPALNEYLVPLKTWGADAVILGCTHYPLIRDYIQEWLPESVLIDPADWLARDLRKRWPEPPPGKTGSISLSASGDREVLCSFWKMVEPKSIDLVF